MRPLWSPRVRFPLDTPALRSAGERRSLRVTQGEKVGPSFALTHWGQSSLRALSTASQACDVPPSSDKAGKTTQPHLPCCHPLSHTHVLGGWRGARATAGDLKDLPGPAARQTHKGIIALRHARQDTDGVATGMQRGAVLPRGQLGGWGHRGASQLDAQKPGRVTGLGQVLQRRIEKAWGPAPALPRAGCGTLGKALYLRESRFPDLTRPFEAAWGQWSHITLLKVLCELSAGIAWVFSSRGCLH